MFLKGTPDFPKCDKGKKIMRILRQQNLTVDFFDLTTDLDMEHALIKYSKLNSVPQLYMDGYLVGDYELIEHFASNEQLR